METSYDKVEDILNIQLKEGKYWKSIEHPSRVVLDIAEDGSIIALEIMKASLFFSEDFKRVIDNVKT